MQQLIHMITAEDKDISLLETPGCRTITHRCQLTAILPSVGPCAVVGQITNLVITPLDTVISGQQVAPSAVAAGISIGLSGCPGNIFPVVDVGIFLTAYVVTNVALI